MTSQKLSAVQDTYIKFLQDLKVEKKKEKKEKKRNGGTKKGRGAKFSSWQAEKNLGILCSDNWMCWRIFDSERLTAPCLQRWGKRWYASRRMNSRGSLVTTPLTLWNGRRREISDFLRKQGVPQILEHGCDLWKAGSGGEV